MSKYKLRSEAVTLTDLLRRKSDGKKISMVTCYDAAFAALVDKTAVDMVLVGDSLGNVMMGFDDTLSVTIDDMIHHSASVARILTRPFLAVDMPFMSYKISTKQALVNAARLVQEGGAQAVKLEGGHEVAKQVAAIVKADIPVIGHIGLTPQSVHKLGGYKLQGKSASEQELLLEQAKIIEEAGAFCLVLEMVPAALAKTVSEKISIPTIGIGAGPHCDGQVLVLQDLLGFNADFNPRFLKKYADLSSVVQLALKSFDADVKEGVFPGKEHSF